MNKSLKTVQRTFQKFLPFLITLFFSCTLQAQALELKMPDQTVASGDTVHVNIEANNFIDMVSIQFSINFDPAVIQFDTSSIMDLDYIAVGSTDAAFGSLIISWFDIQGTGENMPDGKNILKLVFLAVGEVGDYSDIEMTGTPREIQVYRKITAEINEPIDLDQTNGSVTIVDGDGLDFNANITNVACSDSGDGLIDISLNNSENYTYTWTGPNGYSSNLEDVTDLTGGDYQLVVIDTDGNVVLDTILTITQPLNALVIDDISTVDADCSGGGGLASIYPSGGVPPYMYDIGNGFSSQSNLSDLMPGAYMITVTDANNCETTAEFVIESEEGPEIDLGENTTVCEGEEILLEVGTFDTYEWSTGATTASLNVNQSGIYSVTVSNNNCISIDSVEILIGDNIELTAAGDLLSLCPGDSIQLLLLGANEYQWLDDSGTLSQLDISDPVARPTESTEYTVVSSNECGSDTSSIEVQVYEITASAGPNACVAPGNSIQLNASGGEHYYWIGGDYPLSDYNIPNPTITPDDSSTYAIMIVDENNCTTFDSVTVLVAGNPSAFVKHINIITPNGDGDNDVLQFGNISKYGTNTLKVFNRWGDLIYDRVDYQFDDERFDGNYKGAPLPAGTYYYILAFREEALKQTLTIIRE